MAREEEVTLQEVGSREPNLETIATAPLGSPTGLTGLPRLTPLQEKGL
jgi:hypothetical protein